MRTQHNSRNLLHVDERHKYGVTATMESADGETRRTAEFPSLGGRVLNALRELAAYCDRHDLRVTCLSSPQTIYADLKGRENTKTANLPEILLMSRIHRMDLLHPRIRAQRTDPRSHRRKNP